MSNQPKKQEKQKYIVSGYDSFDDSSFHINSYNNLDEAVEEAKKHSGQMTLTYVHDLKGNLVARFGIF